MSFVKPREPNILPLISVRPMRIHVRKLNPQDAETYRELRRSALRDVPTLFIESLEEFDRHSIKEIRRQLADGSRFFLGAFNQEQQLVGMIGFQRERSPRLDHIGFISGLYVASSARGQKLGEILVTRALEEARQMGGVEQVKLQLEAGNARARELYESFGFEIWGTEPKAVRIDGGYYDDYHMILKTL